MPERHRPRQGGYLAKVAAKTAVADEVLLWRGDTTWGTHFDLTPVRSADEFLAAIAEDYGGLGSWWGDEKLAKFYGGHSGAPPSGGETGYYGGVVGVWWPRAAIQGDLDNLQYDHAREGVVIAPGTRGRLDSVQIYTADGWKHLPVPGPRQVTAALTTQDYEGQTGNLDHITRVQRGTVPTSAVADLKGVRGEVPGAHRNRQGQAWEAFKADIAANGIQSPIFITVDFGAEPKISEGNHRRDAAVELGLSEVPVEVRYFGHAERRTRVAAFRPLPVGPGIFYRGHDRRRPFSKDDAYSSFLGEGPKYKKRGYSCFSNPAELAGYLVNFGWTRYNIDDWQVIAFRGRRLSGTGGDGEELAVPLDDEPIERMSWESFSNRLTATSGLPIPAWGPMVTPSGPPTRLGALDTTAFADFPVDYGTVTKTDFDTTLRKGDDFYYEREEDLRAAGMPRGQRFSTPAEIERYVRPLLPQQIEMAVRVRPDISGQAGTTIGRRESTGAPVLMMIFGGNMTTEDVVLHETAHAILRLTKGKSPAAHGKDFAEVYARLLYEQMGVTLDFGRVGSKTASTTTVYRGLHLGRTEPPSDSEILSRLRGIPASDLEMAEANDWPIYGQHWTTDEKVAIEFATGYASVPRYQNWERDVDDYGVVLEATLSSDTNRGWTPPGYGNEREVRPTRSQVVSVVAHVHHARPAFDTQERRQRRNDTFVRTISIPESIWRHASKAASVADAATQLPAGLLREPHDSLYPPVWGPDLRLRPEAKAALLSRVYDAFVSIDVHGLLHFNIIGSGASYNWDEAGDLDVQIWCADPALVPALRKAIIKVNNPTCAELGLGEAAMMTVQFYVKPGGGAPEENLAGRPYACYDINTDTWVLEPWPITPEFYAAAFAAIEAEAEMVARDVADGLAEFRRTERAVAYWARFPEHADRHAAALLEYKAAHEAVRAQFKTVFKGRADAYTEDGQGLHDERDSLVKILEVWGLWEDLKHIGQAPFTSLVASRRLAAGPPSMRLYHGTNQAALDSIRRDGQFRPSDLERVSRDIEARYGLPRDSVWNHPANSFSRGFRSGDAKVYFSQQREVAVEYATIGSEAVFDALTAAWMVMHAAEIEANDGNWPPGSGGPQAWVRAETAKHYQPVLLVVDVPWEVYSAAHDGIDYERWQEAMAGGLATTVTLPAPVPASWIVQVEPLRARTAARKVTAGFQTQAYRGVAVRIKDRRVGLQFLETCARGATRAAADMLIEQMATNAKDRWWSAGDQPADEAGRWWTTDHSAAFQYASEYPHDDDFLVVPVMMTATYDEDAWDGEMDGQGHYWYHLPPGAPLRITQFEADLPNAAVLQGWLDEVESQGQYVVHNAVAGYAMGDYYGTRWITLPIPTMVATASAGEVTRGIRMDAPSRGLVDKIQAGTVAAQDFVAALEPLGNYWATPQMDEPPEGYAYAEEMASEYLDEGDNTGEISVILVADAPAQHGSDDPYEGDAWVAPGTPIRLREIRYDAGWGWKTLSARGITTTAAADLVLYHGTQAKHVPAIRQQGLRPPEGTSAKWYMLTTSKAQAEWYARGDDPVVLEYRVPASKVFGPDRDEDWVLWPGDPHIERTYSGAVAYAVRDTLPPGYLVAVHPAGQQKTAAAVDEAITERPRYLRVTFWAATNGGRKKTSFVGMWVREDDRIKGTRMDDVKDGQALNVAIVNVKDIISIEGQNPRYETWEVIGSKTVQDVAFKALLLDGQEVSVKRIEREGDQMWIVTTVGERFSSDQILTIKRKVHHARRGGYLAKTAADYMTGHQPDDEGPPLHDITQAGGFMEGLEDVYVHPERYTGQPEWLASTRAAMAQARGNPGYLVTVYRAAPAGSRIERGNWVTLSREYAEQHRASNGESDWVVVSAQVPASTVLFAGDDLMEWGYWGATMQATASARRVPLTKTLDGYEFEYKGERRLVFNPSRQIHIIPTHDAGAVWYIRDRNRGAMHDQPVGSLADAKTVLAELMDELDEDLPEHEASARLRFETVELDHDRGLEVQAITPVGEVAGLVRFSVEDGVAEAYRIWTNTTWRGKEVFKAIWEHLDGLGYEVTHRLPLGQDLLTARRGTLARAVSPGFRNVSHLASVGS